MMKVVERVDDHLAVVFIWTGGVDGDDRNDPAIEPVRATRHGRYNGHGDTGSGITPVGAFALAMCVFD